MGEIKYTISVPSDLEEIEINLIKTAILLAGEKALDLPPYYIITAVLAAIYKQIDYMLTEEDIKIFEKYKEKWEVTCKAPLKTSTSYFLS